MPVPSPFLSIVRFNRVIVMLSEKKKQPGFFPDARYS